MDLAPLPQRIAISCIINFAFPLLQWNPGPARRNPTNIVSAACGRFHAVILQEASDHIPHISDYFRAYTDNTDLAILLNKDTFEPDPFVLTFKADSTSKNTWGMVLLIVRALLRRPSLSGSPTVTFCSAHIHNVVAKKRDASTELLQFLHSKMLEYKVDFIGGDFNMSAFLQSATFFLTPSFQPLVIHAYGDWVLWTNNIGNVLAFSSCPSDHTNGVWIRMAAIKLTILRLALAPGISLLTFPSSSTSAIQISLGLIVLCEVSRPSKEDLNADATKNVGRDEVLVCALVNQGVNDASLQVHTCSSCSIYDAQ